VFSRTSVRNVVLSLAVYGVLVWVWADIQESELHSRAICCGLYGDYEMHWYLFPSMFSSELSHWGGGPTRLNTVGVILNILTPLIIALVVFVLSRRSSLHDDAPVV
jgi:hypothetical protein